MRVNIGRFLYFQPDPCLVIGLMTELIFIPEFIVRIRQELNRTYHDQSLGYDKNSTVHIMISPLLSMEDSIESGYMNMI
jgi:hypothetical protein